MKRRHYIFILILIPLLVLFRFVSKIGERAPGTYVVVRVIDGDTVELTGGETLRLLGIDTPEEGDPYYDSAKVYLAGMTLRKNVRVDTGHRKRDRYGRLLGYLYLDTILVNARILKNGYGWVYLFPEDQKEPEITDRLLAAQRLAMADTAGVWALPYYAEEYYIGNSRSLRFHRPSCEDAGAPTGKNKVTFRTREEACYQGYSPCRNCRP
jgi:micrococcal nuclease